jgi:hypothetical protein
MGTSKNQTEQENKFYWVPNEGATVPLKKNYTKLIALMSRDQHLRALSKKKKLVREICINLASIEFCAIEWENRVYKIPHKLRNLKREFEKLAKFVDSTVESLKDDFDFLEYTSLDYSHFFMPSRTAKYIENLSKSNDVRINQMSGKDKRIKKINRQAEHLWFSLLIEVISELKPKTNRKEFLNSLARVLGKYTSGQGSKYIKEYKGRGLEGILERGLITHYGPNNPFEDINQVFHRKVFIVSEWRLSARPLKEHKSRPYF